MAANIESPKSVTGSATGRDLLRSGHSRQPVTPSRSAADQAPRYRPLEFSIERQARLQFFGAAEFRRKEGFLQHALSGAPGTMPAGYRQLALGAVFAVAYFVSARIGLSFATVGGSVTLLWPPSGLALFALLAFGIATGNCLEATAGFYLLRAVRCVAHLVDGRRPGRPGVRLLDVGVVEPRRRPPDTGPRVRGRAAAVPRRLYRPGFLKTKDCFCIVRYRMDRSTLAEVLDPAQVRKHL